MTAPAAGVARGWFVTGTDTGVGKTRASVALLQALRARHARCAGMKPVAAGTEAGEDGAGNNEDVLALRAASNVAVPAALDNPVLLPDAMSPHIAARRAGRRIEVDPLVAAYHALAAQADAVVVEGAGGFLVPLSDTATGADLAAALALPVILVVGLRLGCLNHALLTHEAIAHRGLRLAGWVANRLDPAMPEQDANVDYLRQRLGAPLLADWPWQPGAHPCTLALRLPD
ncbi:dethiobiotin synthase [Methylibium sp.]|uniref:dethiobiotin synthase n=1 Tax=Methylibium sp. TaxID=2067992 RepID=UPI003D0F789B